MFFLVVLLVVMSLKMVPDCQVVIEVVCGDENTAGAADCLSVSSSYSVVPKKSTDSHVSHGR